MPPGAVTSFHCCRLRPSIRGEVLCQDLHIPLSPHRWRHAGLLIRHVGIQLCRFTMRVWVSNRIRIVEYFLQEDYADRFFSFTSQT